MLMNKGLRGRKALLTVTAMLALVAGQVCSQEQASSPEEGQMPTPAVGFIELKAHPVPVMSELPGRIAATRVSEVRARVSGILQERVFEQGSLVQKGDVLYRIDPRLFEVRVASAEAALKKAKAIEANAKQQLERQRTLRERNVVSAVDYDTAAVNLDQADADVASQQAVLDEAKINLGYTEVRAPITGVIGGALATEGTLVTADSTSNLALIQQVDPVYADFTQSAQQLLALKQAVSEGKLDSPAPGQARVELVFDGGKVYSLPGKLLFSNANVDPNTGQVTLRAEFPNPKGDLLPGMYVRVRIEQAVQQAGLTIPQRAVTRTSEGKPQVYVLAADSTAQVRDISLGSSLGSEWVVLSGLKAGEKVIADGVQKVQPGAKVDAEAWKPDAAEPSTSIQATK
ncbi:efflux RND transporter periplasmic adaptor subunit [Rhizobium lusitanum]|uniref:Membrane fusion protein (Multidrug efflux system) n=1 Tax=Rhizobium lusitanum TaxID=293958 RepID=A0A7X0MDB6_9HYPH|nr:efflux RND transporter periplasmic adaptor subunit [Rhizobium lusitanum]MBB6484808.1 membrane fusion protein (multidrug efflux system) [Rhizobium lusitanum]